MDQILQQKQNQTLSLNQIQSLRILSMDNDELFEFIQNEFVENPVMEINPPLENPQLKMIGDFFSHLDNNTSDGTEKNEKPEFQDMFDPSATLKDNLLSQLTHYPFTSTQQKLMEFLINSLDENGFLETTSEEISLTSHVPINQVNDCIAILQSLDPAGVGAANFKQSLILQAKRLNKCDAILETLINEYMPQIASGQFNTISKLLKLKRTTLANYIHFIKTLNPRPCKEYGNYRPQYVIPDIIFTYDHNTWTVTINDNWSGSIGISRLYAAYSKSSCDQITAMYIEKKIKRVRFITNCIEQRRNTLLNLSQYIINKQQAFLLKKGPLINLTAKAAARDLNIHPSTVSRAIHNKYIQTPTGSFPFKYFFQKDLLKKNASDSTISAEAIKKQLRLFIDNEPKNAPYSDAQLVDLFAQKGIPLSRRTISKYREECNINNSYERTIIKSKP